MLENGFYDAGEFGMFHIKLATRGPLNGKTIITRQQGMRGRAFAFLEYDYSVRFFLKFAAENPERLEAIRKVVAEIMQRHGQCSVLP